MKASLSDTIVAVSTPEGAGLRAVIRVSGERAQEIAKKLLSSSASLEDRKPSFQTLNLGDIQLPATVALFVGPRSYTREDLLEIYCISSPPLVQALLRRCYELGARLAEPGEFTRRAFLNGRLNLSQVEGVLELIQSRDDSERRAGLSLLSGGLSARIVEIRNQIEQVLALLEASLDFEEVETGHIPTEDLARRLEHAHGQVQDALSWEERRSPARAELTVFLAGLPNAGKSSLLNQLDPQAKAIVSPIAGTTRDCLLGRFVEAGISFWVMDAAGIQQAQDSIEEKAQELARRFRQGADLVVWVVDASAKALPEFEDVVSLLVLNKLDLPYGLGSASLPANVPQIKVSAKTGQGISNLKSELVRLVSQGKLDRQQSRQAISERHRQALQGCDRELVQAGEILRASRQLDAVAAGLRQSLFHLDEITGETHNEKILDRIFSQFCIGK